MGSSRGPEALLPVESLASARLTRYHALPRASLAAWADAHQRNPQCHVVGNPSIFPNDNGWHFLTMVGLQLGTLFLWNISYKVAASPPCPTPPATLAGRPRLLFRSHGRIACARSASRALAPHAQAMYDLGKTLSNPFMVRPRGPNEAPTRAPEWCTRAPRDARSNPAVKK